MKIENIQQLVSSFGKLRVLIIGDVMVDSYMWGRVERISPEAPVPVVTVTKKEIRPGGAANVALNIRSLGATPLLCSVIGNDEAGKQFSKMLSGMKMDSSLLVKSSGRTTTVKTRIIGNNHQMLRVDEEQEETLPPSVTNEMLARILPILKNKKADVVIFEDYDKGVINPLLIEKVVAEANRSGIPVAVDPKRKNFLSYKHITLMKPNLKELREGLKLDIDTANPASLKTAVKKLRQSQKIESVLVTLSEKGIFVSNVAMEKIFPAHIRNISDVSGAGDTVISVAALCTALKLSSEITARLSNLAGGQVCEKAGVVPVDLKQFISEASVEKIF
ncbi:MAG TPA: bifunctional ADP-heptose synthase [Bacteroidia bacterium]|nr:bifunctional ADP-heptose synthase [Bacteroidia bacterium]